MALDLELEVNTRLPKLGHVVTDNQVLLRNMLMFDLCEMEWLYLLHCKYDMFCKYSGNKLLYICCF